MSGTVCDLLMQCQERDARIQSFTGFGSEADNLQTRGMDLLRQLIDGNVRGCADEHLTRVHLCQMVHDRCRSDCLAGSRGALDKAEWFLEDALHRIHLRMVQFWKTGRREAFGHLRSKNLGFQFVA